MTVQFDLFTSSNDERTIGNGTAEQEVPAKAPVHIFTLVRPAPCPNPRKSRTGEMQCVVCGRFWDVGEEVPQCDYRGDPSKRIASQELEKMRRMLREGR